MKPCLNPALRDEDLVRQAGAGRRDALDELLLRHRDRVRRIALRFAPPPEAEDIVREVFASVFHAAGEYRGKERFTSLLYRIIARACLMHRPRVRWLFVSWTPSGDRSGTGSRVREAIAALPARLRIAVILHRFEGLSYRGVAESLGTSEAAVESLLARAYRMLRRSLEMLPDEHFPSGAFDMKGDCRGVRRRLSAYLHGEDPEPGTVKAHLKSCPGCRRQFAAEERLWSTLGAFEPERCVSGRSRIRIAPVAAMAAVLLGLGVYGFLPGLVTDTEFFTPAGGERWTDLHAAVSPGTPERYPYVEEYDRALTRGAYISFVGADPVPPKGAPVPRRSRAPRYPLPDGRLVNVRRSNGTLHLVYDTPRGTLSIFRRPGSGPASRCTVVRDGREFKISNLSAGGNFWILVSDRLPWPEIALVEESIRGE